MHSPKAYVLYSHLILSQDIPKTPSEHQVPSTHRMLWKTSIGVSIMRSSVYLTILNPVVHPRLLSVVVVSKG